MKALVTGATGFVGSHVARELVGRGWEVRALVRPGATMANLSGVPVEVAPGDLREPASLDAALQDCDALFHVAALYALWHRHPEEMHQTNVQGTENILRAALKHNISRVVYTSTCATLGPPPDGGLGDETTAPDPRDLAVPYKRSKHLAEQVALRFCHAGLPVVIVNPTTPLGPGDIRPTPTGRIILDFLRGGMPAYVNTGLNVVAVEDVARGHFLALERGRVGERYLLGNQNLTLQEVLGALASCTGKHAPGVCLPIWVALGAAYVDEFVSGRLRHRPPRVPLDGVRLARHFMYFDCSKAVRELGLPQTPVESALGRAVAWFQEHGYV